MSASSFDVRTAISDASEVFKSGVWSRAPAVQRSAVLHNLARSLEMLLPQIAQLESLQTGRTIKEMNAQLGRVPEWL